MKETKKNTVRDRHVPPATEGKLGTFAGVFTPSILTILGIILFLRLGYVTGSAGVARALVILAIANLVTVITSQSLSAVATNLKVKGGGDYYLISRTLGYKFGGSIGIVLYLAQSVSVAFYCIGFAEAVTAMLPYSISPAILAAVAVIGLSFLAWQGADYATKFQYVVMFLLVAALASFYLGGVKNWQQSLFLSNWLPVENAPSFWILFAIFFPAVTGFTQGVSMSGDLKDPGKSLPMGTFSAVGLSILVYLSVIIIFAGNLPNQKMIDDYQAMQHVSRWGFLIDAGVVAATLSSAMASFMGGPRILQSLAADKIFPLLNPFAKGSGENNNPRRGVLLTLIIALATISLGQLNLIAQVVSMFFLISYGLLNYATFYEADAGSASFRPRFQYFHKYISLFGALLCLAILIALDVKNGLFALGIMLGVYLYLNHSAQPSRWADSSRAHGFSRIRKSLIQIAASPEHQRDWHPHILTFTKKRQNREKLLWFGDWLCGDTGLMSAVQIIHTEGRRVKQEVEDAEKELQEDIRTSECFCFGNVIATDDFTTSLPLVLQSSGFGPLSPNTVLSNWFSSPDNHLQSLDKLRFGHNLRTAFRLGFNLVIFHCESSRWETLIKPETERKTIDIWWQRESMSSKLMLLFAYLITRNSRWKDAEIRVMSAQQKTGFSAARESLAELFEDARISAELVAVPDMKPETIIEFSSDSGLVFLPFTITKSRLTDLSGYSLERVLTHLNISAMVMAAEHIDLDAEPEEGLAGEMAKAMDHLNELEKQLRSLQKQEKAAEAAIETATEQIRVEAEKLGDEITSEKLQTLQKYLFDQENQKEKLFKKIAKIQSKYKEKAAKVEALGGIVKNEEKE